VLINHDVGRLNCFLHIQVVIFRCYPTTGKPASVAHHQGLWQAPRPEPEELQKQDRDQCCPNLNEQRVLAGADKSLDLQVLLDRLKKYLDLPSVLIDGRHGRCSELQVVCEKDDSSVVLLIPNLDATQTMWAGFFSVPGKLDYLVLENVSVLRYSSFSNYPVCGITFLAGYKEFAVVCPLCILGVVGITHIDCQN
jgi:hypothetical protein